MFCWKCGKEISDESLFCKYCGTSVNALYTADKEEKETIKNKKTYNAVISYAGVAIAALLLIFVVIKLTDSLGKKRNPPDPFSNVELDALDDYYENYEDDEDDKKVKVVRQSVKTELADPFTSDSRSGDYLNDDTVTEQTSDDESDNMGKYKDHFQSNYSCIDDKVFLGDVTHDGNVDMIVICKEGEQDYSGHVYSQVDGVVKEIYSKSGGTVHAGGFFNWYVIQRSDGWDLAEESFGMWQGMGEVSFTEYYLSENGNRIVVSDIICPADDSEVDEWGIVKDEAYNKYEQELNRLKPEYYVLFRSLEDDAKFIETDPNKVFQSEIR